MDRYPDINYHDIDGHIIVPGAWLHLIRCGRMQVCQIMRYAPWGRLWACWVRPDEGRLIPITDGACLRSSVRLRSPLQPGTIEWQNLEHRLLSEMECEECHTLLGAY